MDSTMARPKFYAAPLVAVCIGALLSGCVDNKLRVDNARLRTDFEDSRRFQAEQTSKISQLETDIRQLSGRVDELEFQQNQRFGSALNTIKGDLTSLRRRIPPPPIVPVPELERDEDALLQLPQDLATLMSDALAAIRDGNFTAALPLLESAMGPALDADWMPNVMFWKGVAFEGANNPRGAIEQYLAISARFERYERMPVVLLRQGSLFIRLSDKRAARAAFNKLISDYPKSDEATRARQKLKDLGR